MFKKLYCLLVPALLVMSTTAKAADSIEGLARTCNNCHGDSESAGGAMPSIAGQPEAYLKNILLQWKSGERYSATMGRLVKGYSDEELAALAGYFSKLPWKPVRQSLDQALVKKGKAKAMVLCAGCHGDTGSEPSDDETPKLNGQTAEYMKLELMKYRDDQLKMPSKQMRKVAQKLKEEDVDAVTQYFASQSK